MIYTYMVKKAAEIAFMCHEGQQDKGGYPYIMHPLHLAEQMDDEDSCIVALLHDSVEDTNMTFDDLLEYGFSVKQVNAIRALTHKKGSDYMEYIENQVMTDPIAVKVKMADLKHNMDPNRLGRVPVDEDTERLRKYKKAYSMLYKHVQVNLHRKG